MGALCEVAATIKGHLTRYQTVGIRLEGTLWYIVPGKSVIVKQKEIILHK